MTAMAASSLLGLLEPGSSMMSMLRWELSPGTEEEDVQRTEKDSEGVSGVPLTHDGLVGVRVAYGVWSRNDPCAGELGGPSILDLWISGIMDQVAGQSEPHPGSKALGLWVCYLFTAWRAGVWWRGAGDVQGAGATAGGGGASDPNEDTDPESRSQTRPSSSSGCR